MAIEKKMFVCTDAGNNNNKFWSYTYDTETQMCTVKYGRVGKSAQTESKIMTRRELDNKIKSKTRSRGKEDTPGFKPPYKEIPILVEAHATTPSLSASAHKEIIKEAAHQQLASGNPELISLIEHLVKANRHELYVASGGKLNVDLKTGIVSTPVGVITKDTIQQARLLLDNLAVYVKEKDFDSKRYMEELNDYLMCIPQEVGHSRGWHRNFFTSRNTLTNQSSLLDQLEASADLALARMKAAEDSSVQTSIASTPNLFNAELKILTNNSMISKIERMFYDSMNARHPSRVLKPVKFYEVTLHEMQKNFDSDGAKLSDIRLLWHGTRKFNVLSILKSGFLLPKTLSTMQTTGAMYGNGLYFSDQSTKALNYSFGGVWDSAPRDKNCFMFLADVAMGKYYIPTRGWQSSWPARGYDSTFAKAGQSGVLNNEMIVYSPSRCNIRYLIEFSS
jgi:poly [ADP-ribose] polymerase 2/3/4